MKSISECGMVIFQYPPGTKPLSSNFLKRNLLISALIKKLLVVEAREEWCL
jgi:DNA processing protein